MKTLAALLIILAAPNSVFAQEDESFDFSGTVKLKYIPFTNDRDIISRNYTDYDGRPLFELGLAARLQLWDGLRVDAYPYFLYSKENRIARIGLIGEVGYEIFDDTLWAGWYHHSWHNADIDSPGNNGRSQDAVFAKWNFWDPELCGAKMEFFAEARYFAHNSDPIEIKDVYGSGEENALAEIALLALAHCGDFDFSFRPYLQPGSEAIRYGVAGEIAIAITHNISCFMDGHWFTTDVSNDDVYIIGAGLLLKFD